MMKKLFALSILLLVFFTNAMAYDHKIVERHSFRIMHPEDFGPLHPTCHWGGWYGSVLQDIEQTYDWNGTTTHVSYKSWLTNEERFLFENTGGWQITKNDRTDLGYGLVNTADGYKAIAILNLKVGDRVRFEYYRNAAGQGDLPYFMLDNADFGTARGTHKTRQGDNLVDTEITQGLPVYGTEDIVITTAGNLHINCPSKMLLREVTITYADENYQKATYDIDEVHDTDGNLGYKYTITGPGVLEEKRGAVPYITMRFGHDNDMTIVKNFGNGIYGASCIVDPSNDLDISHDNVKLTANYKKRYQNKNGEYFRFPDYLSNDEQFIAGDATEQESVHQLAQQEVNSLYGREWTIFETNNIWNENADWVTARSRSYKWGDDFENTWPLYGTYFYFFPEVQGKLSVKFYCEGNGEHMPFWWKAQDGVVVDRFVTGQENAGGGQVYEYKDIEVVRGGAYYLCANPTLVGREHPVVRLMSYQFIPTFRVEPLYNVVENGTGEVLEACEIIGGPYEELDGNVDTSSEGKYKIHVMENGQQVTKWEDFKINGEKAPLVKCLGNISSCEPVIATRNGKQYLDIKNITFKDNENECNKGGAIVVNICCDAGKAAFVLTVAYSAADAQMNAEGNRVGTKKNTNNHTIEVKRWDFFSNELAVGQYKNGSGTYPEQAWMDSPKLYKEVHKFDGMTADWTNTYVNPLLEDEPIFKSVYDMEGDNADMLEETEGLIFHTESNLLGIYNENETSTSTQFNDRYIGLMGHSDLDLEDHPRDLIIPLLKAGDRIVIKMGTYGNCDSNIERQDAVLKIMGAYDATGTKEITGDYIIGGSGVDGNKIVVDGDGTIADKSKPYGEYHFVAKGGDFKLEVKDADLLKIYSIEIYRNAKNNNETILTENKVQGDMDKLYILNTQENETADDVELHLLYRGVDEPTKYQTYEKKTGNLTSIAAFGNAKEGETDVWYTYGVPYPETPADAQFGIFKARLGVKTTDEAYVTDYAECMIPVGYRQTIEYPYTWDFTDLKKYVSAGIDTDGTEKDVDEEDLKIWDEYGFRTNSEEYDGYIFAPGGQLYGGKTMFDETRGIGIFHNEIDNKAMTMTSEVKDEVDFKENGGLAVSDEFGFIVPQVAAGQAVYVHAKPVGNTQSATFAIGSGEAKSFTYAKDGIFAMQMADNATTANVTLNFKGYEINKIAVSTDAKKVNTKGWTSESRDHAIDASLTAYMTGKDIKTYLVGDPDHTNRTLKLTDIGGSEANYVLPENTGCVMFNSTDAGTLNIINGGFHLFVPDMHDGEKKASTSGNMMKANSVEGQIIPDSEGDLTNYVLAYKYYQLDNNGNPVGEPIEGDEMFYRAANTGIKLHTNSAYLQMPTADVKPKGAAGAKYTFLFAEYDEENAGTSTAIEEIETISTDAVNDESKAQWYNLNGQKLNGKPSARGIYIKDGKKVYIK